MRLFYMEMGRKIAGDIAKAILPCTIIGLSVLNFIAYDFAKDDIRQRVRNGIERVDNQEQRRMLSIADSFEEKGKSEHVSKFIPGEFLFSGNCFKYISTFHPDERSINPYARR